MKIIGVMAIVLVVSVLTAGPALAAEPAQAAEMTCDMTSIAGLTDCVHHAASEGAISNAGVTQALLSQTAAAQAAYDRGNTEAALGALRAFTHTVQAQAGVHIDAEHAGHMVMHAESIIAALGG